VIGGDSNPDQGTDDEASVPAPAYQFLVMGDTRSEPDRMEVTAHSMYQVAPEAFAVFNVGDITADGRVSQWENHLEALANGAPDPTVPAAGNGIVRQSRFRTDVESFGEHIRYLGVVGNHDVRAGAWHDNWNRFLPGQGNLPPVGGQDNRNDSNGIYYAVLYENALFVALDSEHPSSAQTAWLQAVLGSDAARQSKWIFAFFHHPVYPCNGKSPFDEGLPWVELFEQYHVDVAFVADSHTYERTCPMREGSCVTTGGVRFINSSAGAVDPRSVDATKQATASFGERSDSYDCSEILENHRGNWNHFCNVSVDGCRLTLRCYSHDVGDSGAAPFDELTIDNC
jgi:hypothetical protein